MLRDDKNEVYKNLGSMGTETKQGSESNAHIHSKIDDQPFYKI